MDRALTQTRPALVLLTETEIWPLFLERAAALAIPVALVNGRISTRSFARYGRVKRFLAGSLSRIALFAMQSEEDAGRVRALGAPPERVVNLGNLKYDLPQGRPFADADRLARAAAGRPVLVAGSTGEGEEELVLEAWSGLTHRPLLVLAPRRPERFDEVARVCESRSLRVIRRSIPDSQIPTPHPSVDVYLLDSIGELASIYSEATLAFIGGSLVDTGGQNPIEAWAAGLPAIAGPHMENFHEIAAQGRALEILVLAAGPGQLSELLEKALGDPEGTSRRGTEAARFVAASRGAADRTAEAVLALAPSFSGLRASAP